MAFGGIKLQCLRMRNNFVVLIILTFSTCGTYSTYGQVLTSIASKGSDLIEDSSSMVSFVPSSFGRKLFGGYRITPKECRISISLDHFVPKSNIQYICMFNHECAQRGGIVVGACMDGFLFGACCQVSSKLNSENTLITDAQNIFYNQFQQHHGQEQNENKEITKTEEKDAQNTGAIVLYNTTTTVSDHKELTSSMKTEPLQNDTKTMSFLSSGKINANKTVQMKFDVNSSAINTFDLPMTEIYIKSNQTTKPTHTSDNTFVPSTQEMQTTSKNSLILKEQYVLVPTISHNTVTEKMPANEESTSSSSITTHVEAIETIIQQLNNSNSGLAYSISENLPTPSYVNDISMNPSKVISNSSALALALVTADSNWIHPPSSAVVLSPETNIIDIKHKTVLENKRDEFGILNKFGVAWNSSTEKTKITAEVSPTIPTTALTPLLTLLTAPSRNPSIISNTKAKLNEMNKNVESSSKIPLIFATDTVAPVQETKIVDKMSSTNQSLLVTQSSSIKTTFVPKTTSIKESNITTAITSIANKTSTKQISTYPTKLQSLTTGIDSPVTFFTKQPSKIKLIGNSAKIEDSKKESLLIDDDQSYVPNSLYIHFSEETTPSSTVITSNNIFEITQKQPVTKPIFTSYITGSTTSTPSYSSQSPLTIDNHYSTMPPLVITNIDNNNKLNTPVFSSTQPSKQMLNLSSQDYISDSTYPLSPIKINKPQLSSIYNSLQKPTFIRIQSTVRPITPTILITPKPTILNTVSGGFQYHTTPLNTGYDDSNVNDKNTNVGVSSSYIFNKLVTKPPNKIVQENFKNTSHSFNKYNQFDYYESDSNYDKPSLQSVQSSYASSPSTYLNYPNNDEIASYITYLDNKTPNLDYYGPTPSYPAFHITDSDKVNTLSEEEESYVSVNDFVNFPPVRNPNLNMSATSSAVTSYVDISTPAFVEDSILNNKMDSLVSKIFESLQDTFQSLVDMIGERNITAQPVKLANSDNNAKPNKTNAQRPYIKKTTTSSQIKTTISPTTRRTETANKLTTKSSIKKSSINTTRRTPITTSKKPATRRTTTTTRPPINRKTTKRTTITTSTTKYTNVPSIELNNVNDEIESSDTNSQQYDNEIADIDEGAELNEGEVGRKFQCGVRYHAKRGRIVGGKGSTFGAFPWQVLVRESTWLGLFTKNKCGGVLITNRYVITAAHCQPGFLASLVAVLGEFDISGALETKRSVTKNVKRVIVHRQYDPATFENDIALLELDSIVKFDTHIIPICMPADKIDFTGRMATVTGWGRLRYGGGVPSVLQEVQVPIIENNVCQEMFHSAGHNKKILNSFLCAGYANGQKDSCEGDSGGPLVLKRSDGRFELAGTVSHGIKCAAPYLPGVYMRTSYYKPWLRGITGVK